LIREPRHSREAIFDNHSDDIQADINPDIT